MKSDSLLAISLFLIGIAAQSAIVLLLVSRKTWRRLPVFCLYSTWDLLGSTAVYALMRFLPTLYVKGYFVLLSGDTLLEFCLLLEICWSALGATYKKSSRKTLAILLMLFLLLGTAVWPFAVMYTPGYYATEFTLLLHLSQTTTILRILIFLLLALGSQWLGISWRGRELQIATGLGVYSLANLCMALFRTQNAISYNPDALQRSVELVGLLCLFYWLYCFSKAEARLPEAPPQSASMLEKLGRQAQAEREAAIRALKE